MALIEDDGVPLVPWLAGPMKRAKQRAIVGFGEVMRFDSVRQLVCYRYDHQLEAIHLPGILWSRIKSWQVFSNFLIRAWKASFLRGNHAQRQKYQIIPVEYESAYGIKSMDELIGEILLIFSCQESIIRVKNLERKKQRPEAALFQDPGLD
uniref:Uncharacterized protein n=1 Tax=Oryza meridionalis TaxID=40149 RepID=A0A0E0EZ72_9ORYZ